MRSVITSPDADQLYQSLSVELQKASAVLYPYAKPEVGSVKKGLEIVAQALHDASIFLQISPPPIEFSFDQEPEFLAEVRGRRDNLRLRIDLGYFYGQSYELGEEGESDVARRIRETLGEEMYHVRIARRYPKTDKATLQANEIGGDAYATDRGERAAKSFGKRFALGEIPTGNRRIRLHNSRFLR